MTSPAINVMSQSSITTNSKDFKGFLKYINRKEAFDINSEKEVESEYKHYLVYENNPLKSNGAFSLDNDHLNRKEFNSYLKKVELAEKNNCIMFRDVVSFDNAWLEKKGLYNSKTNYLDEVALKSAIRKGVNAMIKDEQMDKSAFMVSAIHRNTDNIHVHIALSELKNSRPKIFNVETKEFESKYKRKLKSIKHMKSTIANELSPNIELRKEITFYNQTMKQDINKILNNQTIEKGIGLKNLKYEQQLLNNIYNSMPSNAINIKRKMRSNDEALIDTKKLINEYVDYIIKNNPEIQENFNRFAKALSEEEADNKIKYGDNAKITTKADKLERFKIEIGNKVFDKMIEKENNMKVNQSTNFNNMEKKINISQNQIRKHSDLTSSDNKKEKSIDSLSKYSISNTKAFKNDLVQSTQQNETKNTRKFNEELERENDHSIDDDMNLNFNNTNIDF
ncbi:MobP2 family relaxase [Enterococcus raffinosus]|uniref:MobP2 family relaxase n=1 Tax=Enterococcus raffinosus TaxID=71452 RepID=UPI0028909A09|nr:MobP2 family relaxase [Enterococcus raffinosus]MDT2525146.1 MobP2 family relaxase [Enterococcus raffinosus]MDT2592501.1 MobP2 family relaxase [Enterococcus raffinosus]